MDTYLIKEETLTDIADAIREKTGDDSPIQVSEFASEIENISGGGDLSEYFDVNPSSVTNLTSPSWINTNYLKKLSDVVIQDNITSLQYLCYGWGATVVPKFIFNDNVTNIYGMFYNCSRVTEIDVTGFNTTNVNKLYDLFNGCNSLTNIIGVNDIDISKSTSIGYMFYGCSSLTSLDLSNWESSILVTAARLFYNCSSLTFIDIRKLELTNLTTYSNMFDNVPANCLIIVKDATQKAWMNTKFSRLTNVQTVAEYEAN